MFPVYPFLSRPGTLVWEGAGCLVQIEDLEGGGFGVDFFDEAFEDAVLVEDEGAAEGALDGLAVHFLFTPGAEVLQELGGGVGEEAEGQIVLAAETGERLSCSTPGTTKERRPY